MRRPGPIAELIALSRSFGAGPARRKLSLLARIEGLERVAPRELRDLHDCLCFLRAYPDDAGVRTRVESLCEGLRTRVAGLPDGEDNATLGGTGFPGTVVAESYQYPTALRLNALFPGCLDVNIDELEDQGALHNTLVLLVTNNECQGLDDTQLTMAEWFAACKGGEDASDLELLLQLFEGSGLGLELCAQLFDRCELPMAYRLALPGTGRAEIAVQPARVHYQRRDIPRSRGPLVGAIRKPLGAVPLLSPRQGTRLIELATAALACRRLDIASLMYANPEDAMRIDCGAGLEIVLLGVRAEFRDTLESTYFFLVLKNGVPVAYGPASVCLGCCEMGINLFPEFRGGEIRTIYAQFMRCLRWVLGVEYFYLTAYGMGEGNPDAIASGAFWFYRKLGFRAESPAVEALALAEEQRMREDPRHRSDRATLRRLSHTYAFLDISGGECRRLPLGRLGTRQSRFAAREFGGDRRLAEERCSQRLRRLLGIRDFARWSPARRRALALYAPLWCQIEGLADWSARHKRALRAIVDSKAARSEREVDARLRACGPLVAALRALASGPVQG